MQSFGSSESNLEGKQEQQHLGVYLADILIFLKSVL